MGFHPSRQDGGRFRYQIKDPKDDGASIVDVLCLPYTQTGIIGIGTVHHVASRTPNDKQQNILRTKIIKSGLEPTPVMDRVYFHSVYFHEPGGVLFEIATYNPGITIDEKSEELGTHLALPPWLESLREDLVKILPPVRLPDRREARNSTRILMIVLNNRLI